MKSIAKYGMSLVGKIKTRNRNNHCIKLKGTWNAICRDKNGNKKWSETWTNLIVNEGLNESLNITIGGQSQSATWYLGIIDGDSPAIAATDTMLSKAWSENVNISNAVRPTWVSNAPVSSESITNPTAAVFNIDTNTQTVGGAFLVSNNTKGGTTGVLFAAGSFTSKSLDNGDTLEITATFTAS